MLLQPVFVVVRHFGLGTHRRHGSVWSAPAARRPVDIVCDSLTSTSGMPVGCKSNRPYLAWTVLPCSIGKFSQAIEHDLGPCCLGEFCRSLEETARHFAFSIIVLCDVLPYYAIYIAMPDSPCVRVARCHEAKRPRHNAIAQGSRSIMSFPSALAAFNRRRRRSRVHHMVPDEPLSTTLPLDRSYIDALKDAYPERSYYGGPEHVCPYCHAVFWFQERVKNDSCSTQKKIVYNHCCRGGKVNLKPFERPPPLLANLLRFDGAIDRTINNDTAPYVFKINGMVHHKIGTLLPQCGTQPKFAQLYTYDTEHETQNRLGMFETNDGAGGQPDPEIALALLDMLNENNSLVKAFRYTRECLEREGDQKITLRLLGYNTRHDVQYNLPSNGEFAAIIVGDYTAEEYTYDILVHDRECGLKRVSCLRPAYMPLQYPMLFPYGEHGFHLGIRYFGADDVGSSKRKYVTMLEFVRRHLHYRLDEPNPYTCYGRLSDQIDVDVYSTIEGNRLQFIASHQSDLRSETVQGIADAINKGFVNAYSIGSRVVVPASFTGGRRYHVMNYQDAMAICRDREFLVTVTIKKIGDRWWYSACKKCTRTTMAHGDSYKCSDQVCATISTPNQSSTVVPGATPAITKELTTTPRKRTRSSPAKTVTKRLFTDVDGGTTGSKDVADSAAAPRLAQSRPNKVTTRSWFAIDAMHRPRSISMLVDVNVLRSLHV
ncbi:hypothetical protein ZEAMMB73_Zm00001d005223 [Zea mays]|uniref:Helitron helicase-like domain-containing protein n=1 Tax=Zea mays TaxID=4577 RepID=A0A1D6EL58_MAIZE|nr:hypothetical protein ZEAMMB73_Zm00001d005223 [Zea mays]